MPSSRNKHTSIVSIGMTVLLIAAFASEPATADSSATGLSQGQQYLQTDFTNVGQYTIGSTANTILAAHYDSNHVFEQPSRFYTLSADVSQRLETNVLQTFSNPQPDYAFRVNPKVHTGVQMVHDRKATGVYADYSTIKDVFAYAPAGLNVPTNQVVGIGTYHDLIPFNGRHETSARLDCLVRSVWSGPNNHQSDILPSLYLARNMMLFTKPTKNNPTGEHPYALFSTTQLQMRSGLPFEGATHELDPIYTVGIWIPKLGAAAKPFPANPQAKEQKSETKKRFDTDGWTCTINSSLFTNYRDPPFHHSHPKQGNNQIISDIVLEHPIFKNTFKSPNALTFYIKAEPVFNFDSNKAKGLSGFDFRFFLGLKYALSKAPT